MNDQTLIFFHAACGLTIQQAKSLDKLLRSHRCDGEEVLSLTALQRLQYGVSLKQSEKLDTLRTRFTPSSFIAFLEAKKITAITYTKPSFPELLLPLDDAPAVLFVQAAAQFKFHKNIAVVGTRHPTGYGEMVTHLITTQLVKQGWGVVSGGMYGVDTLAHQAALDAAGITHMVLGYGHDHLPDWQVVRASAVVAAGGAVISEYPPWYCAHKGSFPARNRVIAGMSVAVVVTEAAERSGSFITAHRALDYGRSVFAVPGSITNRYAEGTKKLINEGATLVSSAQDIYDHLLVTDIGFDNLPSLSSPSTSAQDHHKTKNITTPVESKLLTLLSAEPASANDLTRQVQLSFAQVAAALTTLEIAGLISQHQTRWHLTTQAIALRRVV